MIISKIALCIASAAIAALIPAGSRAPEPASTLQPFQLQYQPPSGDVNRLASAFPS